MQESKNTQETECSLDPGLAFEGHKSNLRLHDPTEYITDIQMHNLGTRESKLT
jgi:hypothetical protein